MSKEETRMKRKTTILVLVLSTLLLMSGSPAAALDENQPHCLLGFLTMDLQHRTFCQYTLPPGNCIICYMEIEVKTQV
jgi:hypothetical protein